ncbi:MAG: carbohydrate ABC transporter permease [Fimbriimonadaceae bacterium]
MPNGWPYALGTLLCWAGLIEGLVAAFRFVQVIVPPRGTDPMLARRQALVAALTAGASLLVSGPLLRGHEGGRIFVPLAWLIMPFAGWLALAAAFFALISVVKMPFATRGEQVGLAKRAAWLALLCAFAAWLFRRDPSNSISLLKGAIPLTVTSAGALLALALAATLGMALSGAFAKSRGYSRAIVVQIALLVGSVVFGLPFAWLVITSLKEDQDMASPHGLIWIPKVTETVPYMNRTDPVLEGRFEGQTVQASIITRNADGTVTVNITRPGGIAGRSFTAPLSSFKQVPMDADLVWATYQGLRVKALVADHQANGKDLLRILTPSSLRDTEFSTLPDSYTKIRHVGLKWSNYPTSLEFLSPEANHGLTYLGNTLYLVALSVVGTLLSSSIVAYAFSRLRFPGRGPLFALMLSTMMLPGAVTMLPQFLIFRSLGWIDTLRPLWVPAFLASAFNVFLLRQFLMNIPMELEDAAKIDGCTYLKTFWSVMLPQITPALAVIGIWTFMGAWNNFMGPLIYVTSPEHMPISYAVQQYNSDQGGEPGYLMAVTTMSMLPVLGLFFFAQRYFIEGVTLSGLGGR